MVQPQSYLEQFMDKWLKLACSSFQQWNQCQKELWLLAALHNIKWLQNDDPKYLHFSFEIRKNYAMFYTGIE